MTRRCLLVAALFAACAQRRPKGSAIAAALANSPATQDPRVVTDSTVADFTFVNDVYRSMRIASR